MSLNASTAIGVAWGNFDRVVETKGGEDTLRDTIGIAYKELDNSQPNILENNQVLWINSNANKTEKKKTLI